MDAEVAAGHLREYFAPRAGDVAAVYLFGSTTQGTARPNSDVDVGVLFRAQPHRTLEGQPFDLADDLDRRLGARVDLVVLNTATPDLRVRVLRGGRLVVEHDRSARIRF